MRVILTKDLIHHLVFGITNAGFKISLLTHEDYLQETETTLKRLKRHVERHLLGW